jgi:hypothetical protein
LPKHRVANETISTLPQVSDDGDSDSRWAGPRSSPRKRRLVPAILERRIGFEPLKRKGELLPQWAQIQTGELRIALEDPLLLP